MSSDGDLRIADKDFNKFQAIHMKVCESKNSMYKLFQLGYKEGSFVGHEASLQAGFDTGYKIGIVKSVHWSRVLGKAKYYSNIYCI